MDTTQSFNKLVMLPKKTCSCICYRSLSIKNSITFSQCGFRHVVKLIRCLWSGNEADLTEEAVIVV